MRAGMPDPTHQLNRDRTRDVRLAEYQRFLMHTALLRGRVSQMMRATSLNRQSGARHTRTTLEPGLMRCARENVRLAQENQVLRQSYSDLTAAAETWIRLYESALARANAAELKVAGQAGIKA
jgi:hypothetical protein